MNTEYKGQEELLMLKMRFKNSLLAFNELYNQTILPMLENADNLSEKDIQFLWRLIINSDAFNNDIFKRVIESNYQYIKLKNDNIKYAVEDDATIIMMIDNFRSTGKKADSTNIKKILNTWPRYFEKIKFILDNI